jgi:hypothetical protein
MCFIGSFCLLIFLDNCECYTFLMGICSLLFYLISAFYGQVYRETVEPIIPIIFERTKATCFAYGQTG